MSLKQCADSQDSRGYSTYLKFLAEVDRYIDACSPLAALPAFPLQVFELSDVPGYIQSSTAVVQGSVDYCPVA